MEYREHPANLNNLYPEKVIREESITDRLKRMEERQIRIENMLLELLVRIEDASE